MSRPFYRVTRDLHLYFGLFISPFILLFAVSVFFLTHRSSPNTTAPKKSTLSNLSLPPDLENLSGRPLVDQLIPILKQNGIEGEIGWVQHFPKDHRFVIPISVPGRNTTVTLDINKREASVEQRVTGLPDALITLHFAPGPHMPGIRKNWVYMLVWSWLADATVYLTLFITVSGIYLWYVLRSERKVGIAFLLTGAATFLGMVYALWH
ncbi:MAG TPA: PepSY-associated TM helix domain-containing protein [Verrucomicrobiae bacterium]|nr:PepSY-associated TM helix domain-containing protein [Verrucomicrobiae bacterium]